MARLQDYPTGWFEMFVLNGNAEQITKLFRSFGLNEYEARVYFALQVCGKTRAGELWKKVGIPQSKVYYVLPNPIWSVPS